MDHLKDVLNNMTRDEMREFTLDLLERLNDLASRIEADEFYNAYGTLKKSWDWGELKELIGAA